MTKRVAILCEFPTLHGGERSLLAVLPSLAAADWSPVTLCPAEGALAEALRRIGVTVVPFLTRDEQGNPRDRAALRAELADQLKRVAPQLLHANSVSMGRLAGPVVEELRLPSIAHVRDILTLSRPAVADLNRHTRLLAVSNATRAAHVAQGVDEAKTQVLYNGVDLRAFVPRPSDGHLHRELDLPSSAKLVGCVGQIILRKGQDTLAAAATLLAERAPELHYVFVGARHSEKPETRRFELTLRETFDRGPLAGHGHFLGARDDVADLLPELTMLVHPARQEPLGRVLLEGAACGCAMVATDVGGTREIFPPNAGAAILIPPDEPSQLAEAMVRLIEDSSLRHTLGMNARQRVERAFDAEASAAGLIRHYNEVARA